MATRFYLPSTGTASVDPGYMSLWGVNIGSRVVLPLVRTKTGTAKLWKSVMCANTTPESVLCAVYVSEPLAAQSVSGNWTAVVSGYESNAGMNASLQIAIRVVSSDGLTTRGTVYGGHSTANNATANALGQEWPNTVDETRIIPSTAGTSVTAQAGDVLVIELGYRADNTANTAWSAELDLGDNQGSDYALTAGTTGRTSDAWVETDQTLSFVSAGPRITLRAAGTSTAATDAVTAINPAVPTGTTTGDLSVLTVAMKPYSTTITTPSGWTKIGEGTNGTVASGVDTGSMKVAMFVKESATVGAIGALTLAGSPSSVGAVIHSYAKSSTTSWDYTQFTTGGDTVNDANYLATGAAGILAVADDWVIAGTAVNSDLGTITAHTVGGMAGVTLGTAGVRTGGTASGDGVVTTGNDSRVMVVDHAITAGASNAPPTASYTNASSTSGTTLFLRLRARSTFAPPDAFVGGTIRAQQSGQTSSAVTVPTGTAVDQIAVVDFWVSPSGITPTAPAGFTLQSSVSLAASTRTATLFRYWKRLTAADAGSYTFTTASAQTMGICTLWSGRRTVGSPFDSAEQTNTAPSGVTTAVACPDVNITPNTGNVVLLYGVAVWTNGLAANTVSQSFGDAMRNGTNGQLVAFKDSQPATASGNVNTSGSDNWIEILSALLPATTDAGFSNNRRQAIRRAANW